jgi:hypothetical protein
MDVGCYTPPLGRFTRGRRASCAHWIGGSVCPKTDLDVLEKTQSVVPAGAWTPDRLSHGLVNIMTPATDAL